MKSHQHEWQSMTIYPDGTEQHAEPFAPTYRCWTCGAIGYPVPARPR